MTLAPFSQEGEGPDVVLEGKFGFLDVYAHEGDPALLSDGLGTRWESLKIWYKIFPCHVTAQSPVAAVRQLQREYDFAPQDVSRIVIEASDKVLSHHADRAPRDVGTAQYSVPFCVALSLFRDPGDPQAFLDGPGQDPRILELCQKIELRPLPGKIATGHNATCRVEVKLADGRSAAISKNDIDEAGGEESLERRIEQKYSILARGLGNDRRAELLRRLQSIEQRNLAEIFRF